MHGRLGIALIAVVVGVFIFLSMSNAPGAQTQRARTDRLAVEYKVIALTYNPGERLTDEQRSAAVRENTQHRSESRLGTGDIATHTQHGADNWRRCDNAGFDVFRRFPSPPLDGCLR